MEIRSIALSKPLAGLVVLAGLAACDDGSGATSTDPASPQVGRAISVWNQAYQENTEVDSFDDILTNASNAYVLLDPDSDELAEDGSLISSIQANGNEVGAYISVGTGETWRDDFAALQPYLVTKQWGDWEGEYFVSTPNDAVLDVMKARVGRIASMGFDWVEFDNMDWAQDDEYRAEYQFEATTEDAEAYYGALCDYTHGLGMKCMAKSTVDGAEMFDGATYESYPDDQNWWDQDGAASFLSAGKPVVVVHYDEGDCAGVYAEYQGIYGADVSFICEDPAENGYVHFNTQ